MEQLSKRRLRTVQKSIARKSNSCTSLWGGGVGLADSKLMFFASLLGGTEEARA